MPLFEFVCRSCGHEFEELLRSASERNSAICPKCNARDPERKMSVFAARGVGAATESSGGGCMRCGDPQGPCGGGM